MTVFMATNESETQAIAAQLAAVVKAGDIIALDGTLGVGKTVFCRGFIRAFLPDQEVPSPTFTLLQTYDTDRFPIYHFDLYRLKKPEEVYELGIEDAFADGVSLIEWPEKMGGILPKKHIHIRMETVATGRRITIEGATL